MAIEMVEGVVCYVPKCNKYKDIKSYNRIARKEWERIYGERPYDADGKRYEVHHIDTDVTNNDISNLICVSKETHRVIHLGRNHTMSIKEIMHLKNNTVPEYLAFDNLDELVTLLHEMMLEVGTELTEENGMREGWTDLMDYPLHEMSDEEMDAAHEKAYHFIWSVAYPLALKKLV